MDLREILEELRFFARLLSSRKNLLGKDLVAPESFVLESGCVQDGRLGGRSFACGQHEILEKLCFARLHSSRTLVSKDVVAPESVDLG